MDAGTAAVPEIALPSASLALNSDSVFISEPNSDTAHWQGQAVVVVSRSASVVVVERSDSVLARDGRGGA